MAEKTEVSRLSHYNDDVLISDNQHLRNFKSEHIQGEASIGTQLRSKSGTLSKETELWDGKKSKQEKQAHFDTNQKNYPEGEWMPSNYQITQM